MDDSLSTTALNGLTDVVLLCRYDPTANDSVILWCNDASLQATGMTRDEVVGLPPRSLLPRAMEFDDPTARQTFFDHVRERGTFEFKREAPADTVEAGRLLRVRLFWLRADGHDFVIQAELSLP